VIDGYPEDIIITFGPLGGLGDVSLYTTLPQRFTEQGHKVYLDRDNLTRNPEIMDFWYAPNPHIIGTSDKKPNAGYINQGEFYRVANAFPMGSIEAMERVHGLPPPYSLAPRTYYVPKPFSVDLSQRVLVDLSARSTIIGPQGIQEHVVTKMNERFAGREFIMVTFPQGVLAQTPLLDGPSIRMNSIFDYADALNDCYAVVCSEAGSQAMAAAIRGEHDVYDFAAHPEIISIISPKTFNSRGYTFRGVDYRVCTNTSNSSGDYWSPAEQPYQSYQIVARRAVEQARDEWDAARAAREVTI
jgi:hypothetical protein